MVDVLLGLQWGDEGKGKIVDYLAPKYDIVARFQGGPNAGHTLYLGEKKVVLHTIPSGVFHEGILNLIGNGVVIDPVAFQIECEKIEELGVNLQSCLLISEKAHVIIPTHKALDKAAEQAKGINKIGSTLKGIGPTYMDKTGRNGLRVGDILSPLFKEKYQALKEKHLHILNTEDYSHDIQNWEKDFFESVEAIKKYKIVSSEFWINEQLTQGKKILAEGAQGTMLDIDFGTYPFVTSSNTITAGLCIGLGIAPKWVNKIYGISKAYCTRVGSGPFPTELNDDTGELIRKIGNEFGATTGRPRRCGWIDLVALKYACMLNGVTDLIITKADVLDEMPTVGYCTAYQIDEKETTEFPYDISQLSLTPIYKFISQWDKRISTCKNMNELPNGFIEYLHTIESYTSTKISFISNGVGREQLIVR